MTSIASYVLKFPSTILSYPLESLTQVAHSRIKMACTSQRINVNMFQ